MRKCRSRNRIVSVRSGIAPTKERRRQNGGIICEVLESDSKGRPLMTRYRAVWECPLDVYRDRKLISPVQYRAGLRFHRIYRSAVLRRHRDDLRPTSLEQAAMEPTMQDKLLNEAYHILVPGEVDVVITVCGHNQMIYSAKAYEKLRKGLGHLAIAWHTNAIAVCEHEQK